jgi:hypothetical protein
MHTNILIQNLKEEYELVNFDVDGILKAVRWVTLAQEAGSCEHGDERSVSQTAKD